MVPYFLVYCRKEGLDHIFILNEISLRIQSNNFSNVYVGKESIRSVFRFYIFYIGKENVRLCVTKLNDNRYKIEIRTLKDFLLTK